MITPALILTIDTEGDNLWQNHQYISTKNARFLPRFQTLCEKYRFKPVYLTNYEMATDDAFIDLANNAIASGNAEIGMHLHAWNSPPFYNLTGDDWFYQPYLIEYPESIMQKKILFMTQLLEDTFQTKIISHRAGRWAFDERYAAILLNLGYQVDCSVTPLISWHTSLGTPQGIGGTNYYHFPNYAYFIDCNDISRPGESQLLEIPMTTCYKHAKWINTVCHVYNYIRGKQYAPSVHLLRPTKGNVAIMYQIITQNLATGSDYVEFMLHSSEFMPGGSLTFKTESDIEQLYQNLEQLFDWLQSRVICMTLAQYYQQHLASSRMKS